MLKLIIKHKGKILQEVTLQEEIKYTIGRGQDNTIVLPEKPGISRKHLLLSFREYEQWTVKNLSQIGELNIAGEEKNEGTVTIGESFQIQDFEFILQEEKSEGTNIESIIAEAKTQAAQLYKTESQLLKISTPKKNGSSKSLSPPAVLPASEDISSSDEQALPPDGKTRIMDVNSSQQQLSAYLKISYDDDTPRDIFKLEDQEEWICGRDEEANIMVDNPNISREHFKIKKEGGQYYIADLKSSNGTILNDKELIPGKAYPIQSADVIYILDIEITFEIKNLSLEKELAKIKLPAPALSSSVPANMPPGTQALPAPYLSAPFPANLPSVIMELPEENPPSFFQKNKKRLMLYGTIFTLITGGFLFNTKGKKEEPEAQVAIQTGELAGLSTQQIQIIKDTYQVAQQLFSQGKFEYCISEIKKIHEFTESYQDSKKLETACSQASENQRRQHNIEQKKQKAARTEKFIQEVANKCMKDFDSFKFKYELVACLNPAIELSPADSRINMLTEKFDAIEMEKEDRRQLIAKRKRFISSIAVKYNYAKSLYKSGKTLKAISAYQKFINISKHRELKEKHELARRELATIKKNFNDNNRRMTNKCKSQFNDDQFQKSYYTCEIAVDKIPPPHNKLAISLMKKSRDKLEIKMKPLYEEASLNESVGNVNVAQEYWQKILNLDVNIGVYYKRAQEKLNKY